MINLEVSKYKVVSDFDVVENFAIKEMIFFCVRNLREFVFLPVVHQKYITGKRKETKVI